MLNKDEVKSGIIRLGCVVTGWMAGRYHLSQETVGLMMSDIGYAGSIIAFALGTADHWNMKKVAETAKVVVTPLLLVALAVGAFALAGAPAYAGDINPPKPFPVKSRDLPKVVCTPSKCNGMFLGIVLGTNVQNTNVLPTLQSVSGGNGFLGGEIGYRVWSGNFYVGASFDALMQSGQSGTAVNFNPQNFMGIAEGQLGVNLAGVLNVTPPNPSQGPLQNIPAELMTHLMTAYLVPVSDCFNNGGGHNWIQRYCGGLGAEFAIGGPLSVAVEYLNVPAAGGLTAANLALIKARYNF